MNARRYNLSSEHAEQVQLIKWAELNRQKWPMLQALFAIANGGHRHITVAMQMKAEGVKPGVPDLMHWRDMLQGYGYCVQVCKGWEEAKDAITNYLTTQPPQ